MSRASDSNHWRFCYSLGSFKSSIFATVINTAGPADQASAEILGWLRLLRLRWKWATFLWFKSHIFFSCDVMSLFASRFGIRRASPRSPAPLRSAAFWRVFYWFDFPVAAWIERWWESHGLWDFLVGMRQMVKAVIQTTFFPMVFPKTWWNISGSGVKVSFLTWNRLSFFFFSGFKALTCSSMAS